MYVCAFKYVCVCVCVCVRVRVCVCVYISMCGTRIYDKHAGHIYSYDNYVFKYVFMGM